jgi:hypothetical protein
MPVLTVGNSVAGIDSPSPPRLVPSVPPDLLLFIDRLIADDEARAALRAAENEAAFLARALTLAHSWALEISEADLKNAGQAASRRWMEHML